MFDTNKINELFEWACSLSDKQGQILNWSGESFDKSILNSTPEMIGKSGINALQESHIFLLPVWDEKSNPIDWELVKKYNQVVDKFNMVMIDSYPNWKQMKNPLLALNFVNKGYLTVMQSSLYLLSNNKEEIINCTHLLAKLFSLAGFVVVREKIEASVYGIDGIPLTNDDASKYTGYFEFHIRVESNENKNLILSSISISNSDSILGSNSDQVPLSREELKVLDLVSDEFTEKFGVPVPTSFNRSTHIDGGYQRYLNVRFRNTGSSEALSKVKEIVTKINNETNFKVVKVISEYVWYDTFVELDKGWIDF